MLLRVWIVNTGILLFYFCQQAPPPNPHMFKRTGNLISIQIQEPPEPTFDPNAKRNDASLRGTKFGRFESGSDTDDDVDEESASEEENNISAELQVNELIIYTIFVIGTFVLKRSYINKIKIRRDAVTRRECCSFALV